MFFRCARHSVSAHSQETFCHLSRITVSMWFCQTCSVWVAWRVAGVKVRRAGFRFVVCCCQSWWLQWPAVLWVRRFCKRCGKGPTRKASGLASIYGTLCVCAHHPAIGMSWGSTGHTASFSFLVKKESVTLAKVVPFKPVVLAETLKA